MFRISELERNCPTLFWIGEITSFSTRSFHWENSSTQKLRTTGSVIFSTTRARYDLSTRMRVTPKSVLPGYSRSAKIALRRMYSRRGPQESAQIFLRSEERRVGKEW